VRLHYFDHGRKRRGYQGLAAKFEIERVHCLYSLTFLEGVFSETRMRDIERLYARTAAEPAYGTIKYTKPPQDVVDRRTPRDPRPEEKLLVVA
jgi:hypothetical protein